MGPFWGHFVSEWLHSLKVLQLLHSIQADDIELKLKEKPEVSLSGGFRKELDSTPAASTNIQSTTRFSRSIHKEGGIFFAVYSRGFSGFDIFMTVLRSPHFLSFSTFHSLFAP
ncbi:MAG: hypothetical protein VR64_07405 [Desulfatitalea sp. BRH_c12]|nr:MAG: hypothetical protein VR64_07405 [Desulfatitalea sp. BRH_c12]